MENKLHDKLAHSGQPAITFRYVYNNRFEEIAAAFIKKYNWEATFQLTTITGVH
jgi:hypothetical protein